MRLEQASDLRKLFEDSILILRRDPNPRVDGGGVQLLRDAGIAVDMMMAATNDSENGRHPNNNGCANLVTNFCKRIAPRNDAARRVDYESYMTGKLRRGLRSTASRRQAAGTLPAVSWGGDSMDTTDKNDNNNNDSSMEAAATDLDLAPEWMEHVDAVLWQHELVLLRLNKAVSKKKGAMLLGERIAQILQAHVAQTKGHTVLLYRPGVPPVLDLEQLVVGQQQQQPEGADADADTR